MRMPMAASFMIAAVIAGNTIEPKPSYRIRTQPRDHEGLKKKAEEKRQRKNAKRLEVGL